MNVETYRDRRRRSPARCGRTRPPRMPRVPSRALRLPHRRRRSERLPRRRPHAPRRRRFNVSDDVVTVNDRNFARGSRGRAQGQQQARRRRDAGAHQPRDAASPSRRSTPAGPAAPAFGSSKIHFVKDPKIALVGGPRVSATSYGMLWHTLDVDTPLPHTNLSRRVAAQHRPLQVRRDRPSRRRATATASARTAREAEVVAQRRRHARRHQGRQHVPARQGRRHLQAEAVGSAEEEGRRQDKPAATPELLQRLPRPRRDVPHDDERPLVPHLRRAAQSVRADRRLDRVPAGEPHGRQHRHDRRRTSRSWPASPGTSRSTA